MKIAIFTMSLGKYDIFFEDFYESINKFFLPSHEKTFYVFSDKELPKKENLRLYHQEKMGWPYDTMMRFHLINKIKDDLLQNDFLFFFNINMKALREIGDEVLPDEKNDFLMGCMHPIHYNWPLDRFPYERNPNSTCYIPYGKGKMYYQGCFNGGKVENFLNMSEVLEKNIDKDISNGIIPIWHDESMLNWFYCDKNPLTLNFGYICPEGMLQNPIMIQRDKGKLGGHNFLRG